MRRSITMLRRVTLLERLRECALYDAKNGCRDCRHEVGGLMRRRCWRPVGTVLVWDEVEVVVKV